MKILGLSEMSVWVRTAALKEDDDLRDTGYDCAIDPKGDEVDALIVEAIVGAYGLDGCDGGDG